MRIFDYVDREVPMLLRMFERRLRAYRALGYACVDVAVDDTVSVSEPTVEYDQEAIKDFDGTTWGAIAGDVLDTQMDTALIRGFPSPSFSSLASL